MDEIWIEKYRPKRLNEVVGQTVVVERLRSYIQQKNIPHLLFSGPPGTGKTTAATVLAREFYGEEWKENFLELNASDDRGIKMVRETVKDYSRILPTNPLGFKILFLDEADYMTDEAQAALRRTMENFTRTTRFIISCNYSSKIIEPIQSRTAIFRFKAIPTESVVSALAEILRKEGREYEKKSLDVIAELSYGDMRKAINTLQVAATYSSNITVNSIYEAAGLVHKDWAVQVLSLALKGDISKAKSMLEDAVIKQGISGQDVVEQFHRVVYDLPVKDDLKADILFVLGDIDFRISEGAREIIQLESFLGYLYGKGTK
ncbi:MAG: replication factor C small subunit [Thermoplasmatales archaeon]|jgi:replication factor C small subunit|nr:replication factor C small subunit [Candidatus Thermoplasmatota archaeon]MDA8055026.1 replication factor C small subunit [Thermoplasmatales archaeon]